MKDRILTDIARYILENNLSTESKFHSRRNEDNWRRWYLMLFMRKNMKMTYYSIGRMFGKDHSTVIHGLKMYDVYSRYEDFQDVVKWTSDLFPLSMNVIDGVESRPELITECLLSLEQNL